MRLVFILFLFLSNSVFAEILVLVHGFDSSSHTWAKHGIAQQLQFSGWQNAGNLSLYRPGGEHIHRPVKLEKQRFVTVDLPPKAPIHIQANLLETYLHYLNNEAPEEEITLIAHSAGGIVARFVLVRNQHLLPIKRLITIASPHLGSAMAEVAEIAAKSPISWITPIFGADAINGAEDLLSQLKREEFGSFLFWLNHQPHPDIEYVSIVRGDGSWLDGDYFVEPRSQNLNFVRGIRHSQVIITPGKHWLHFADAHLITQILSQKQ